MNYYFDVLKKYAVFTGRARRKEYWIFFLCNVVVGVVLSILDRVLGTGKLLNSLYSLAVFLPGLGVAVRRLHDTNRSGWWFLFVLVPLVGPIILLVWLCLPGTAGSNQYGEDPLAESELISE